MDVILTKIIILIVFSAMAFAILFWSNKKTFLLGLTIFVLTVSIISILYSGIFEGKFVLRLQPATASTLIGLLEETIRSLFGAFLLRRIFDHTLDISNVFSQTAAIVALLYTFFENTPSFVTITSYFLNNGTLISPQLTMQDPHYILLLLLSLILHFFIHFFLFYASFKYAFYKIWVGLALIILIHGLINYTLASYFMYTDLPLNVQHNIIFKSIGLTLLLLFVPHLRSHRFNK